MKVSCILTSFNRPKWVRDALTSVATQTHQDIQLIVIDESDEFSIHEVLRDYDFPEFVVRTSRRTPGERASRNCLSENCNAGLSAVKGDLVCFLADDDYLYPNWFERAVAFFLANPVNAAYGKLVYSYSAAMEFPKNPDASVVRFYPEPVREPFGKLDHNQVIHRRFTPAYQWPLGAATVGGPDAFYFREIANGGHVFHPIDTFAAVKRIHRKGLMESQQIYLGGGMEGLRE